MAEAHYSAKALELYSQGKTDREIADACGVDRTEINRWRRRRGLEIHPDRGKCKAVDVDKVLDLYGEGKNDIEIAIALGCTQRNVSYTREKLGLPGVRNARPGPALGNWEDRAIELWKKGLSNAEIADEINVSTSSLYVLQKKKGIKPNRSNKGAWKTKARQLHAEGRTDQEIANLCGVSPITVNHWRTYSHLAQNTVQIKPGEPGDTTKCSGNPGCKYWDVSAPASCDFIGITGRRRGCPCGDLCTEYEPRKAPPPPVARSKALDGVPWQEKAREYYDLGLTDREIAERVGMSRAAVSRWRKANGLSVIKQHQEPPWCCRARKLYDLGYDDEEIAYSCEKSMGSVIKWRTSHKLKPNHPGANGGR